MNHKEFKYMYNQYIQSPQWKEKRLLRLKIDGHACRLCGHDGSGYHLEVHHKPLSYKKIPNESVNDDLTTLCIICHRVVTSELRRRRFEGQNINILYRPNLVERELQNVKYSEVQTQFSVPANHALRRSGESNKSDCATDEKINWQTRQDNRRP